MTTILTLQTARKVATDSVKVAELGKRYEAQGKTLRRVLFREAVDWIAIGYEDEKATAAENGAALSEVLAIVMQDIVSANPGLVKRGFNARKRPDGNGYNPEDNTLPLYWAPGSDKASWTATASREVRAIREALAKDGSIVKHAKAWLKRENWTPAESNSTPMPKHMADFIKLIKEEGVTRAEVKVMWDALTAHRAAA